jgi:hypothetical protein
MILSKLRHARASPAGEGRVTIAVLHFAKLRKLSGRVELMVRGDQQKPESASAYLPSAF